jgi:colicin import membrane protein
MPPLIVLMMMTAAFAQERGATAIDRKEKEHHSAEAEMLARARAEREMPPLSVASEVEGQSGDAGDVVRELAIRAEVEKRLREAEREGADVQSSVPAAGADAAREGMLTGARVTVLLAMQPGRGGLRVFNPTADPIVCIADACWISRGPDREARRVPRRKALGALNTLGGRAGACNDSLSCVFRNVEIPNGGVLLEPVDLRLFKHDWRRPVSVEVDESCRIERRGLVCAAGQAGSDTRVLVVPERVAREAGAGALAKAAAGYAGPIRGALR